MVLEQEGDLLGHGQVVDPETLGVGSLGLNPSRGGLKA